MQDEISRSETFGWRVARTADGHYAAVPAQELPGALMFAGVPRAAVPALRLLPTPTRILLYDTVRRLRVGNIKVDPSPKEALDFAISPDGSRMAVLIDDQVKLFVFATQ